MLLDNGTPQQLRNGQRNLANNATTDGIIAIDDASRSLLSRVIQRRTVYDAIIEAARRYSALTFLYRTSVLRSQSSDGIARHGEYNRVFAQYIHDHSRADNLLFIQKPREDENLEYICDVIFYDPYNHQSRFSLITPAHHNTERFQFLHMTGTISDLTLSVHNIGLAREEYLANQSLLVSRNLQTTLFPDVAIARNESVDGSVRFIIVTELRGLNREHLSVWACLPDGQFDAYEGNITLSAKYLIYEETIGDSNVAPVQVDNGSLDDNDFDVTPRERNDDALDANGRNAASSGTDG